jgi:hypothetical protein
MIVSMPAVSHRPFLPAARLLLALLLSTIAQFTWAQTCTSNNVNTTWGTAANWTCTVPAGNRVPLATDAVTIRNGDTVTINSAAVAASVTIGQGTSGVLRFSSAGSRTLTVGGNITVANGASFIPQATGATLRTHTVTVRGNFVVNGGTVNFRAASGTAHVINTVFARTADNTDQTISGTGGTIAFNIITPQRNNIDATVDITHANFGLNASTGHIRLQATGSAVGTVKLSAPITIAPFDLATLAAAPTGYLVSATARFTLNHASATVNFLTGATVNNLSLNGELVINQGTFNLGPTTYLPTQNKRLRIQNAATAKLTMGAPGGTLNVSGQVTSVAVADQGSVVMSAGTIVTGIGGGNFGTFGPFFLGTNTSFNWTGGTITIQNPVITNPANEFEVNSGAVSGTCSGNGGTLNLGHPSTASSVAAPTFKVASRCNVGSLIVHNTTASTTGQLAATFLANGAANTGLAVTSDVTIDPTNTATTLNANGINITVGAGNSSSLWTNNGTFTSGSGTVTFTGTASSANTKITGTSATTFNNLTINKASNNVTVDSQNPTVNGTLTMTSGNIVFSGSPDRVILGTSAATSGGSSSSFVAGKIQKNYSAAASLSFGAPDFPIGVGTLYTPVDITAGTVGNAGNLLVFTTTGDHPSIASSSIDSTNSVNRYWTMTAAGGLTLGGAGTFTAAYTFVNPTDLDVSATPTTYFLQAYDGATWLSTSWVGATTTTNTAIIGAFSVDIAIGNPKAGVAAPGRFNAFDTSTTSGAVLGTIGTKVAGTAFQLDVIHLNPSKAGGGGAINPVTVQLLQVISNNNGTCPMDTATGCRPQNVSCWNVVATIDGSLNISNATTSRATTALFTSNQVYREARVKMTSGAEVGCSGDAFAIRPASIGVTPSDNDWSTVGTARTLSNGSDSGGNVHKAGSNFTLKAAPVPVAATNYDGDPTIVATGTSCLLPASGCSAGTFALSTPTWSAAGSGVRQNDTASYTEVGAILLELEDKTFADIDIADTSLANRTVPGTTTGTGTNGKSVTVGRFVPDRFNVTTIDTPIFQTFGSSNALCGRSFTYIGQPFWYSTSPKVRLTAVNTAGTTTVNYRDSGLFHITTGMIAQSYSNNSVGPTLNTGSIGSLVLTNNNNGTADITLNSGTIKYNRDTTTPASTFTANISLTYTASDTSEGANGTIDTSPTPVVLDGSGSGIAFDLGAGFRYGRLRMSNALGTEQLPLPIPMEVQYWNGTAFATNTIDNCTNLTSGNISLSNYQRSGADNWTTTVSLGSFTGPSSFSAGVANLKLTKPTGTITGRGSVDASVNLTAESKTYLQGAWTGTTYTQDPSARGTFGVYKGSNEFIYIREMY